MVSVTEIYSFPVTLALFKLLLTGQNKEKIELQVSCNCTCRSAGYKYMQRKL